MHHRMGPVQKKQRKMSVWAVAGLWGRIGWFPDLVSMNITQIGGKHLIISAIPRRLFSVIIVLFILPKMELAAIHVGSIYIYIYI